MAATAALVVFVVLCARNGFVFTQPIYEDGDGAANSILVNEAKQLRLLVGHYSRLGFNHPGPAFLYVQALGESALHDLGGIVPAPFNGQVVALFALNAVLIGMAVRVIFRVSGSLLASLASLAVILFFVSERYLLPSNWIPHLHFAPFLLFLVAGVALIAGRSIVELPGFILGGSFLVHGHASLIGVVIGCAAIVGGLWLLKHRRNFVRALWTEKRPLAVAVAVLAVFLLPMFLNIVLHFPGEWRKYVAYGRIEGKSVHYSLGEGFAYLKSFWPLGGWTRLLYLGVAIAAVGLWPFDDRPDRRKFVLYLMGAVVFLSILFWGFAIFLADDLVPVGVFYHSVPLALLLAGTIAIASVANRSRISMAAAGLVSLSLFAISLPGAALTLSYRGVPEITKMVAAVKGEPGRAGRPVYIEFEQALWVQVVGFVVAAERAGIANCVEDPLTPVLFTRKYICSSGRGDTWHLRFDDPKKPPAKPGTVIWPDAPARITLVEEPSV